MNLQIFLFLSLFAIFGAAAPQRTTFSTGDISIIIPDNSQLNVSLIVSNLIKSSATFRIYAVVFIPFDHSNNLELTLVNPIGVKVPLVSYGSSAGQDAYAGTTFDDLSLYPASSFDFKDGVPQYSLKPISSLFGVSGSSINGQWNISISDSDPSPTSVDLGRVLNFQLIFESVNFCEPNPCQKGGYCLSQLRTFSCFCESGYGPTCSIPGSSDISNNGFENPLTGTWSASVNVSETYGYDFTPHSGFALLNLPADGSVSQTVETSTGTQLSFWIAPYLNPTNISSPFSSSISVTVNDLVANFTVNSTIPSRVYPEWELFVVSLEGLSAPFQINFWTSTGVYLDDVLLSSGDQCQLLNCQNGGTCSSGVCTNCGSGFTGSECQIPTDPCTTDQLCGTVGTCNPDGSCDCQGAFGEFCAINSTCPCANGVSCVNNYCDDPCALISCGLGTCEPGGYCDCTGSGYEGTYCEIDECSVSVFCANSALCTAGVCNCSGLGFEGTLCDIPVDPCANVNCNSGVCVNGACQCSSSGYVGSTCSIVDPCTQLNCHLGTCQITDSVTGEAICNCTGTGYQGSDCSQPEPCTGVNCDNGGFCSDTTGVGLCDCGGTLYSGPLCDTLVGCSNGLLSPLGCSCYSGYSGTGCSEDERSNCSFPAVNPLVTEIVGEFQKSQSSLSNSTFLFLITSQSSYERVFQSLSLNGVTTCTYPFDNTRIVKGFDNTTCQDSYSGNYSIPELIQECGFNVSTEGNFIVLTGSILAQVIDPLGVFRTQVLQRSTFSSLSLRLRIPYLLNVTTVSLQVQVPVELLVAITSQSFDPNTGLATIQLTSSSPSPYYLLSPVILNQPQFLVLSPSITNYTSPSCSNSTYCVQITTIVISNITQSPSCSFDGFYAINWNSSCQGDVNCFSIGIPQTNFTLQAGPLCADIEIDSRLSGDISVYSDASFQSSQIVFTGNSSAYFKVLTSSDVVIQSVTLLGIQVSYDDVTKNLSPNSDLIQDITENVLASQAGFGLYLSFGPGSDYLFDSTIIGETVSTFSVQVDLQVTYTLGFARKREVEDKTISLKTEAVFTPLGHLQGSAEGVKSESSLIASSFIFTLMSLLVSKIFGQ